jgi:adenylate cyclase
MPQRWPYSRTYFAKVIEQLKNAGARIIAFDFIFLGQSNPEEDNQLTTQLNGASKVILATTIDENGQINASTLPASSPNIHSGFVTKLQDADGVIRKSLIYLVNEDIQKEGYLSWGMEILKLARDINLSTLISEKNRVTFRNSRGKKWVIPIVDTDTQSFLIHFRAHTEDFPRLSFYDALNGNFNASFVKNKIVLVGLASALFADIHNTPLGWLPGVTLNANAFLTLYTRDFLRYINEYLEIIITLLGVIITSLFVYTFELRRLRIFIGEELALYFVATFFLLTQGYIWHRFLFPLAITICPLAAKKIVDFIIKLWLNISGVRPN